MHHISSIQISSTFSCISECLRKSCCNPCRAGKYFCKSRAEVIRAQRWWRSQSCHGSFANCFVPCSPAETQGYSCLSWGVFMLERKKEAAHLDYLIYEGGCDAVARGRASRPGEVSPADSEPFQTVPSLGWLCSGGGLCVRRRVFPLPPQGNNLLLRFCRVRCIPFLPKPTFFHGTFTQGRGQIFPSWPGLGAFQWGLGWAMQPIPMSHVFEGSFCLYSGKQCWDRCYWRERT